MVVNGINYTIYVEEFIIQTELVQHYILGGNTEMKIAEPKIINPLKNKTNRSWLWEQNVYDSNGLIRSLKSSEGSGNIPKILETQLTTKNKRLINMLDKIDVSKTQAINMYNQCVHNDTIQTITAGINSRNCTAITKDYRIRKLTEKECWRLMGVKEQDFENVSKNQSMSSLYHLTGDSIMVTCLMAIFGELFDIDYNKKINELVEKLKNE